MPIYECDPWREQYFSQIDCPADVHIPTDDIDGYKFNPRHRWIYNRLKVAQSQGIECGSSGTAPHRYPVFCKPVTNLKGMGAGTRVLECERAFAENCGPDDFWMKLLTGVHVSSDWAVVKGEARWVRHTRGIPGVGGTFDYWIVEARARRRLERYCRGWIRANLADYSGMMNIETIGGRIIEAHLRFADQWPDLYGPQWLEAVVRLYQQNRWDFAEPRRTEGYSVVLFGPHGRTYTFPSRERLASYRAEAAVSSVQITFFPDRPQRAHVMPPGGFRLAVINSACLEAAVRLRARMARDFGLQDGGIFAASRSASEPRSLLNARASAA
jgi:hypothetical protein